MSLEFHAYVTSTFPPNYFPEEDLLLSAEHGGGYFWPVWRELLRGKYEILLKLGWDHASSTWLAVDLYPHPELRHPVGVPFYCSIKVFSACATQWCLAGVIQELELWASLPRFPHPLPELLDHFFHTSRTGYHLCLVTHRTNSSANEIRLKCSRKVLTLDATKALINSVLEGLQILHASNIIHGNINAFNTAWLGSLRTEHIDEIVRDTEGLSLDPNRSIRLTEYGVSVVLPIWTTMSVNQLSLADAEDISARDGFFLIGLERAQKIGSRPAHQLYPGLEARSPELLLGAEPGWEADIWAVGCLTFEMLTGRTLFKPVKTREGYDLHDLLWQMTEATGQNFSTDVPPTFKTTTIGWHKFFDDEGNLIQRRNLFRPRIQLEERLLEHLADEPEHALHASNFIRTCLRLDPLRRVTAKTLLTNFWIFERIVSGHGNWFSGVEILQDDHVVS